MNEEDDAALVNSFFLPGGILDPDVNDDDDAKDREDDTEDRSAYVPFSFHRHGAPSQNPWETPVVSHLWNETAEPSHAPVGDENDDAGGRIGISPLTSPTPRISTGPLYESDALCEPTRMSSTGPLHESDTLMRLASSNYRQATTQNPELLYPDYWNMHTPSTEPFWRGNLDAMPFRPPPGFEESIPTSSIPTEVGVKAVDEKYLYEEDSLRSDSSVPLELFERESYTGSSASSLSGPSVDEVSSPISSSLHMDEITENELSSPRSSSHVDKSTENELSSPRSSSRPDDSTENDATQHDNMNARLEVDVEDQDEEIRERYKEADENAVICSGTVPLDTTLARKTKKSYRDALKDEKAVTPARKISTMSTVVPPPSDDTAMDNSQIGSATTPTETSSPAKLCNRQGGKAKSTAAPQSASTVCASPSFYQTCGRSSLEWILTNVQWMLQYLLTSMTTGAQAFVVCCRFMIPFWTQLCQLLQQVLFTILCSVGIIISVSVLVYKSALLEAVQETRVSLCYAVLYFFPSCISALMTNFALPHFTPHLVSCAVLYGLCHSEKREKEMTQPQRQGVENVRRGDTPPTLSDTTRSRTTARPKHETSNAQQTLCQTILRYARFTLPVIVFLEGFSSELGAVMSLGGSGRLMSAYILTILRKDLLFSPIAWLSSALQLLIASYLRGIPWIDFLILAIGLASVRFSRFLEKDVSSRTMKAKES